MRFSPFGFLKFALFLFLATMCLHAQTFRGGVNGTVTDPSGAVVAAANVDAMNSATGVSYKTVSSSGGEFEFQDLPLGSYVVTVQAGGFKTEKIEKVPVSAGTIYTLPV